MPSSFKARGNDLRWYGNEAESLTPAIPHNLRIVKPVMFPIYPHLRSTVVRSATYNREEGVQGVQAGHERAFRNTGT